MNYEEKYKTALKRARIWKDKSGMPKDKQGILDDIFPELAESESEDERIRETLIDYFKTYKKQEECGIKTFFGIPTDNVLAWLEKQCEQKPYGQRKKCFDCQFNYAGECKGSCQMKRDEQKTADKVERKFKEGDYIVNDYCKGKVIELTADAYLLDTGQGIPFSCEHNAHLWSIADAKDGDILTFDNNVCTMGTIICKSPTSYDTKSYCRLIDEHFIEKEESGWDSRLLIPATKDQCDLFFQKMKEAGCRWNSTEKKLEKIDSGKESESKKEEWTYSTEECNCIIQDTISICEQARKNATNEIDYENTTRCIGWLKILKYRHTWKPSKEQMDTLLFISSVLKDEQVIVNLEELKTLYNDLKKL